MNIVYTPPSSTYPHSSDMYWSMCLVWCNHRTTGIYMEEKVINEVEIF